MNAKNLPFKFAFLALLVIVCIWSLLTNGLKQGIDLRGGHSLVFEIRTNADEAERIQARINELKEKLNNSTNETERTALTKTVQRLTGDLKRARRDARSDATLAEDMIKILKERVDPLGLFMLEWRPVGENRFEVRMPAGNPKTQKAKNAFLRAIRDLENRNVERSGLRQLEDGKTTIPKLAEKDTKLAKLLENLLTAHKAKVRDASQKNISAWEVAEKQVLRHNIEIQVLQSILNGYVRQSELDAVRNQKDARESLEYNKETHDRAIKTFRELAQWDTDGNGKLSDTERKEMEATQARLKQHPEEKPRRLAAIDDVIRLYRAWADMRQELEDPSDLIRVLTRAGVLEFRIAPMTSEFAASREGKTGLSKVMRQGYLKILTDTLKKEGPQGLQRRTDRYLWFPVRGDRKSGYGGMLTEDYGGQRYLLLSNFEDKMLLQRRDVDRWALTKAYLTNDTDGFPAVGFTMNEAGAKYMHALTRDNLKEFMAILVDNEVKSAPIINDTISSNGIISMSSFNPTEVDRLIMILRAGSLPAKLIETPVAQSSFGPTFGEANREMGKRAAIIGLVAVAVFMCVYYLTSGVIAIIALILNIVLVLGTMSMISAVFTLPGIAGIILTIGIAVDANVLIFERLREEQQKGTAIRIALANAYKRAFSAIFDANITTVITCIILGWVGTEEVRGFAVTLSFGVIFSMFTSLVVTRWIFQLLLDRGIIDKPLSMMHVIGVPKINWMGKRHFFWLLSLGMVVMGVASIPMQGWNLLGIEFSAGTQAVVTFRDDALIDGKLPNAELVRRRFMREVEKLAYKDHARYGRLAETAKIEARYDYDKVGRFVRNHDTDGDKQRITPAEWKNYPQANDEFFKLMDTDSDGFLTRAELEELPETSYQITTTEISVPLISETAANIFGAALQRRISYPLKSGDDPNGYTIVENGPIAELGLQSGSGYAVVRPNRASPHAEAMEDFADGVAVVVRGLTPAMSVRELRERIEGTQMQPDFAKKTRNRFKVAGLVEKAKGVYSDFAVFSRSGRTAEGNPAQSAEAVADDLTDLLIESLRREEAIVAINFDPAIAGGAAQSAIIAIIMSWIAIVLYVWVRFGSIRWGLAAVICLIHDVVIVVGLLAATVWMADTAVGGFLGIGAFKIDLAMVAAILTVIGYSVNDTIVVFDRIRENRGKLATVSVMALNSSVNQTLGRTLLTSTTTLIVVLIMYVAGGAAIRPFSFALLVGVLFGTYSSIAVASPLLMGFRKALVVRTVGATGSGKKT